MGTDPITVAIVTALASGVSKKLFAPKEKTPAAPPAPQPEPALATPDSQATAAARRRRVTAIQTRSGAASTVLTDRPGAERLN